MSTNTISTIQQTLKSVFSGYEDTQIEPSQRLREDLGIDSLRMVELLVAIEESCGILFEESDLEPTRLNTIEDIKVLIENNLK